ncbi:phage integrase family protein [Synechococcus sp. BIOS-E4-1]|uniref:hypothetical protein n=1 Tax=Synechococcus sp. BIOS-E4-1 TaxID=1400864 RepID=UPI001648728A|nr:hypothetical protein [Synechococcus sp. BIOS-E4-1]QNI54927.1 phage integrase family protein [Synechococcus sp. BIOS-E4-1]
MPRKTQLLPYLQASAGRNVTYVRRIPAELQEFMDGQRWIRRSLGIRATDCKDPNLISAWSGVHAEVEEQLAKARAAQQHASTSEGQETALRPRDVAAIAAEPWLQIRNAMESGQISTDIQAAMVEKIPETLAQRVLELRSVLEKIKRGEVIDMDQLLDRVTAIETLTLEPILKSLDISPSAADMRAIVRQMLRYAPDARADITKLQEGDFSPPSLAAKAPPLPTKQLTWDEMMEQYKISTGGITEEDGVGVSKTRVAQYELAIREICLSSGKFFPLEITRDDVRKFVNELQTSDRAISTQLKRLDSLRNLFNVGIQSALVDENPFLGFKIMKPRGAETNTYRSFTRDELKAIRKEVRSQENPDRNWVIDALICTGARANEIVKLRTDDIKQSDSSVWFFDFKHEPQAQYPTSLKGAQASERRTPLHTFLIQQGYLTYLKRKPEGYVIELSKDTTAWSKWFKERVLEKLGIWEKHITGLHSLRNTAIDMWREEGVSAEVRRALVAHAAKDVQDRVYGEGVKNMPDVLFEELKTVDLSWLP